MPADSLLEDGEVRAADVDAVAEAHPRPRREEMADLRMFVSSATSIRGREDAVLTIGDDAQQGMHQASVRTLDRGAGRLHNALWTGGSRDIAAAATPYRGCRFHIAAASAQRPGQSGFAGNCQRGR